MTLIAAVPTKKKNNNIPNLALVVCVAVLVVSVLPCCLGKPPNSTQRRKGSNNYNQQQQQSASNKDESSPPSSGPAAQARPPPPPPVKSPVEATSSLAENSENFYKSLFNSSCIYGKSRNQPECVYCFDKTLVNKHNSVLEFLSGRLAKCIQEHVKDEAYRSCQKFSREPGIQKANDVTGIRLITCLQYTTDALIMRDCAAGNKRDLTEFSKCVLDRWKYNVNSNNKQQNADGQPQPGGNANNANNANNKKQPPLQHQGPQHDDLADDFEEDYNQIQ